MADSIAKTMVRIKTGQLNDLFVVALTRLNMCTCVNKNSKHSRRKDKPRESPKRPDDHPEIVGTFDTRMGEYPIEFIDRCQEVWEASTRDKPWPLTRTIVMDIYEPLLIKELALEAARKETRRRNGIYYRAKRKSTEL